MYKLPIKKICEFCGTIYFTRSSKSRACSKKCAKQLWNIKVREKGGLVYNSGCGRKKGITPWNKNKECPQLKGENNGFYGHSHSKETIDVIREKVNITKAKNRSFNISHEEDEIGRLLKIKFPDLLTQYKSEPYPFNCDFYIPSKDLYIEYNGHWTHGIYMHDLYAPYDPENPDHQWLLNLWKSKNSKYFDRAIKTWTKLDPLKASYVKKNNLNMKIFYYFRDFRDWYSIQEPLQM